MGKKVTYLLMCVFVFAKKKKEQSLEWKCTKKKKIEKSLHWKCTRNADVPKLGSSKYRWSYMNQVVGSNIN